MKYLVCIYHGVCCTQLVVGHRSLLEHFEGTLKFCNFHKLCSFKKTQNSQFRDAKHLQNKSFVFTNKLITHV